MKTNEFGLTRRDELALDAAKLYYSGLSQQEVSEKLHVGRPTVSKLLSHAKERGFIQVEVRDPRENDKRLSELLRQKYALSSVHIVSPVGLGPTDLRRALGRCAAGVLVELLTPGDHLGVVWSETIHELADACEQTSLTDISAVQLRGSFGDALSDHRMRQSYEKLSVALNAECFATGLPALFSTREQRNLPEHRSSVARLLTLAQECRVVVFSPGTSTPTSRLFRSELLTGTEKQFLAERSVGDICSHYVDANARICLPDANSRVAGISLPDLRKVEQKVLVAGGEEKIAVIHAALSWGYANRLVVDVNTAVALSRFEPSA